MSFAVVAPLTPIRTLFTYSIPEDLQSIVAVGERVIIPFGRRLITGVITAFTEDAPEQEVKPLWDVLDATPLWTAEYLAFSQWVADYYLSPLGEVLAAALPQGMKVESNIVVAPLREDLSGEIAGLLRNRARKAAELLRTIAAEPGGIAIKTLQKRLQYSGLQGMLRKFENEGWVVMQATEAVPHVRPLKLRHVRFAEEFAHDPVSVQALIDGMSARSVRQSAILSWLLKTPSEARTGVAAASLVKNAGASPASLKALIEKKILVEFEKEVFRTGFGAEAPLIPATFELNKHQHAAIDAVAASMKSHEYVTHLLHGVTGSGKTQVYIELVKIARAAGQSAIILVPEIGLTPQLVDRFRAHFPKDLAVLHSRMSLGERFDAWRSAQSGDATVIVGARSALFAPARKLGLIVVDEEHDASYKQTDTAPRYNARDCAVVRGRLEHCAVVLGSATPSLESYANALQNKYVMLGLPERVDHARMPKMIVVDMRAARKAKEAHNSISHLLRDHIALRLLKREGIILLQNRRGFAPTQMCSDCGASPRCPHCAVTLTYHKFTSQLRCHYCGHTIPALLACMECGSTSLKLFGTGTQRVEEDLRALFPAATIVRMDLDTTTAKGSHKKLLEAFGAGEADILLGTQMVAKGLDFPRVTLVGVVSADTQLYIPDFRASERTFQLITQVAGRAGRTQDLAGEVVIQTSSPDEDAIRLAVKQDFQMFYAHELRKREKLSYPPVTRLVLIELRGRDNDSVRTHASTLAQFIPRIDCIKILGPQESPIAKIRDEYRWRILIKNDKTKDPGGSRMRVALHHALDSYSNDHATRGVRVIVDVDPQGV